MFERSVWAEIDLSAIDYNMKQIKNLLKSNTRIVL